MKQKRPEEGVVSSRLDLRIWTAGAVSPPQILMNGSCIGVEKSARERNSIITKYYNKIKKNPKYKKIIELNEIH